MPLNVPYISCASIIPAIFTVSFWAIPILYVKPPREEAKENELLDEGIVIEFTFSIILLFILRPPFIFIEFIFVVLFNVVTPLTTNLLFTFIFPFKETSWMKFALPPTFKLPPIPTPFETIREPVPVESEGVLPVMRTFPLNETSWTKFDLPLTFKFLAIPIFPLKEVSKPK